jgi:hypothetical protein
MKPGIYQSAAQFDRYDNEMRRTYLAIDPGGRVIMANLPERRELSWHDMEMAPMCWTSVGAWTQGSRLQLEATRGISRLTLECSSGEDHIDVIDPAQDDLGGFGGRYERIRG